MGTPVSTCDCIRQYTVRVIRILKHPPISHSAWQWSEPSLDQEAKSLRFAGTLFIKGRGDAHSIAPNDVRQGDLENCGAMAIMAALAATKKGRETVREMLRVSKNREYFQVKLKPYVRGAIRYAGASGRGGPGG